MNKQWSISQGMNIVNGKNGWWNLQNRKKEKEIVFLSVQINQYIICKY